MTLPHKGPADNQIFVAEDGSPLAIYFDSAQAGLSARVRKDLIRKLKEGGAELKFAPKDATIILAEGAAADYADSYRDKVVLGFQWVHASVSQGTCYAEDQNWGDFRVFPSREQSESPPATPKDRPASITGHDALLMFNGAPQAHIPAHTVINIPQIPGTTATMPFGQQLMPYLQQSVSNAYIPQLPAPTPQIAAQSPQFVSQPQPSLSTANSAVNPTTLLSGPQMTVPVALQQAILDHMMSLSPNNLISTQLCLLVKLIAEQHTHTLGIATSLSAPQSNLHLSSAPSQPPVTQSQRDGPAHATSPETKSVAPSHSQRHERVKPSSVSQEKASFRPSSTSVPRKRKVREETPSERTKNRRAKEADTDTKQAIRSKKSETTPHASSSTRDLFVDRHNRPVPFFVQSGTRWRNDAVNSIRKYGGAVVADISECTYAIIYPQADYSLDRLREAMLHNKKAVTSAFVHDSCACEELVDVSDPKYSLNGRNLRDGKGRVVLACIADIEKEIEPKIHKSSKKKARAAAEAVTKKVPSTSTTKRVEEGEDSEEEQEVLDTVSRLSPRDSTVDSNEFTEQSSLPAPPTTATKFTNGKNFFTDEEVAYCRAYCNQLIDSNPSISQTELSEKLAKRMPQHSARSWANKICKLRLDSSRYDTKPASSKVAGGTPSGDEDQQPSPTSQHTGLPLHYQEDKEILVSFLQDLTMKKEFKEEDDIASWQRLSNEHACRSAPSWEDFWNKFHEDVTPNLNLIA